MTQTHDETPAEANSPMAEGAARAPAGPAEHEIHEPAQGAPLALSRPGRLALPPAFCLIRLR